MGFSHKGPGRPTGDCIWGGLGGWEGSVSLSASETWEFRAPGPLVPGSRWVRPSPRERDRRVKAAASTCHSCWPGGIQALLHLLGRGREGRPGGEPDRRHSLEELPLREVLKDFICLKVCPHIFLQVLVSPSFLISFLWLPQVSAWFSPKAVLQGLLFYTIWSQGSFRYYIFKVWEVRFSIYLPVSTSLCQTTSLSSISFFYICTSFLF